MLVSRVELTSPKLAYSHLVFLFLSCISPFASSQTLESTKWISIEAIRKDGSKILDRSPIKLGSFWYVFGGKKMTIHAWNKTNSEQNYSIKDNVLTIGEGLRYSINLFTSSKLILTEIPNQELTDDKVNRITMINSDYYFEYLVTQNKLKFLTDSIVECDPYFRPIIKKSNLIEKALKEIARNQVVAGNIMLTSHGKIREISIDSVYDLKQDFVSGFPIRVVKTKGQINNLKNAQINKLTEAIGSTNGLWVLPKTGASLTYKVYYHVFLDQGEFRLGQFDPETYTYASYQMRSLIAEASDHFSRGTTFAVDQKFEKAINEFDLCIKKDSLYLDAYYNQSYILYQQGKKELACNIWRKLGAWSQKEAQRLHKLYCQ